MSTHSLPGCYSILQTLKSPVISLKDKGKTLGGKNRVELWTKKTECRHVVAVEGIA